MLGTTKGSYRGIAVWIPLAAAALAPTQFASGASGTWKASGHTDSYWSTSGNWVEGAPAGNVGVTVSDIATFNGAGGLSVIVNQTRNIGSIAFDTASAGAFVISPEGAANSGFYLNSTGSVSVASSVVNTQTVSAPLFTRTSNNHAFSFTNNSVVSGVNLVISGDFTHRSSGATTLTLDGAGNGQMSGDLVKTGAGSFNVTKNGAGAWTLSGSNAHENTTLSAGRLNLASSGALGTGTLTFQTTGASIDNTSGDALELTSNNPVAVSASFGFGGTHNLTFGTGTVSYSTTKTITLSGTNKTLKFQGALNQTNDGAAATMTVNNGAGSSGNQIVFEGGGGLNIGGNSQRVNVFNGDANIVWNGTIYNRTSSITGNVNNGITYSGTGKLTLGGDNAFTGTLTISSGTVQIGAGGATGSLATPSGSNGVTNNGTLIFDRSTDSSLTRVISGTGDLIKRGAGDLVLTRVNTFNGDTRVEGGSLVLDSVGTIANSDTITLGAGASLDVTAKTSFAMAGGQEFTFVLSGNNAGRIQAQELNITNAVVDFSLIAPTTSLFVIAEYTHLVGTKFASEGTLPNGYSIVYDYANGTQIAVVPEPATLGLLGLAAMLCMRRRG